MNKKFKYLKCNFESLMKIKLMIKWGGFLFIFFNFKIVDKSFYIIKIWNEFFIKIILLFEEFMFCEFL